MEATSTLADALLDDLDDLSDADEIDDSQEAPVIESNGDDVNADHDTSDVTHHIKHKRLLDDPTLLEHISTIRSIMDRKVKTVDGSNVESAAHETTGNDNGDHAEDVNHGLLVQSNQGLLAVAQDLTNAHALLCQAYEPKFPELEELIPDAAQYVKAVRSIGNETDFTTKSVNDALNKFLSNHQIITLSVAGSTTAGRPLTPEEYETVDRIALYMEEVLEIRDLLTLFIEQHVEVTAPNMHALIGAATSAKLLALTGGLPALAKIPACNLQVLGQVKHGKNSGIVSSMWRTANTTTNGGTGVQQQQPHQGVLGQCDLVQRCPRQLQSKALKVVAAKLALAIRCDYINTETARPRTAESGQAFRQQIETKFIQWQEPDKAPVLKALPKPDLTVKKRRGGRRMRRLKERFEETALMKQANTRAFSTQTGEYGDDAMGKTLGLLDASAEAVRGGALRKNTAEKRKVTYANTRASRKKAAQGSAKAAAASSGLASSMVFTPVQGMELVNPDAARDRVREANRKWFSDNAGFQSALPRK